MNEQMCGAIYERVSEGAPQHVPCTYVRGHSARHSWWTLQQADEAAAAEAKRQRSPMVVPSALPEDVRDALGKLASGEWDAYIEAILNVGHNRKKALRGVRGFPELFGHDSS